MEDTLPTVLVLGGEGKVQTLRRAGANPHGRENLVAQRIGGSRSGAVRMAEATLEPIVHRRLRPDGGYAANGAGTGRRRKGANIATCWCQSPWTGKSRRSTYRWQQEWCCSNGGGDA